MPTVLHRLARWADSEPQAPAQKFKRDGAWHTITAREFMDRVYHLALYLESRGIGAEAAGAIFSPNNPQWVHLHLAALLTGAKSAGIYPNSISKDVLYILNHTEAKVVGVASREFFSKIVDEKGKPALPKRVELIIVFDNDASVHPKAVAYEAAIAEGKKLASASGAVKSLGKFLDAVDPQNGSILIYTSGTTGNPKGALLSHDNLAFTSDLAISYWRLPPNGSLFSFLPLCHVAETLQNIGVGISRRYCVNFCTKFDNVAIELPEVQPSLLLCVPRLWEKMMEGVLHKIDSAPAPRKKLASWALSVGARVAEARYANRSPAVSDRLKLAIADRLVLGKVRHALGLGRVDILASGAAALPAHVAKWFRSLGLEILEDFGQTESTGVICMTEPGVDSLGTVGKPVPGVEMKIAEDGEMLTKGRQVFKGYFKDEAATAQALEGGWLHTGDLAEINERGLVRIRGRKKEILKTSGGKMIAPLPIEEALKAAPIISQVCMVGDGRKYLAALITLSETKLKELESRSGVLAGETITAGDVVDQVKAHVDRLNRELASYEQIKKFTVLAKEFSIADGEMTPTLKMKRNVIESRYRDVIDRMYA